MASCPLVVSVGFGRELIGSLNEQLKRNQTSTVPFSGKPSLTLEPFPSWAPDREIKLRT